MFRSAFAFLLFGYRLSLEVKKLFFVYRGALQTQCYESKGNFCTLLHYLQTKTTLWTLCVCPSVDPHVCLLQQPNQCLATREGWFLQIRRSSSFHLCTKRPLLSDYKCCWCCGCNAQGFGFCLQLPILIFFSFFFSSVKAHDIYKPTHSACRHLFFVFIPVSLFLRNHIKRRLRKDFFKSKKYIAVMCHRVFVILNKFHTHYLLMK